MTAFNDAPDSHRTPGRLAGPQESPAHLTYFEIARRIARETLEADHQALELDAKLVSVVHQGEPTATDDA